MNDTIDTTRLTLLLNELRLPAIKQLWEKFTERSDKEGWPAARLLMALAEHEIAARDRRRIERNLGKRSCCPARRWRTTTSKPCDDLQGAGIGAVRRGRLARPRGELTAVRAARRG